MGFSHRIKDQEKDHQKSRAMARAILIGVAGATLTLLVWKVVTVSVAAVPFSFHLTCIMVMGISLFSTLTVLFRLSKLEVVAVKRDRVKNEFHFRNSQESFLIISDSILRKESSSHSLN